MIGTDGREQLSIIIVVLAVPLRWLNIASGVFLHSVKDARYSICPQRLCAKSTPASAKQSNRRR